VFEAGADARALEKLKADSEIISVIYEALLAERVGFELTVGNIWSDPRSLRTYRERTTD
jgi:hypothetical protein